jgi:hypothetical protein
MNMLFYVAGTALLVHLVICWLLQRSLAANDETLKELFAIPNQGLGVKSRFQLLRFGYYLPWKAASHQTKSMDGAQRLMLRSARVTGVLVPLCALVFLALAAS